MKESFYLKHDYNSRNDEKVLKLRREHPDGSGYAIYWMLLEKLGESSEGRLKLSNIEDIGFDLHFSCERIADVINQHMLFENDGTYFWSNRLLSDLAERNEKSKQGKLAAKVRWDKERKKMQTHSGRNTDAMQGEERIGEERKGEEAPASPAATTKIRKALRLPDSFPEEQIIAVLEKYPKVDVAAVASKVAGKYIGKSYSQLWPVFITWCGTEKPKEKNGSELTPEELHKKYNKL